jgi:hypothetical protein
LLVCVVADRVNEEEYREQEFGAEYRKQQFGAKYREQEPEDPYREQELPEGFEHGKSNSNL